MRPSEALKVFLGRIRKYRTCPAERITTDLLFTETGYHAASLQEVSRWYRKWWVFFILFGPFIFWGLLIMCQYKLDKDFVIFSIVLKLCWVDTLLLWQIKELPIYDPCVCAMISGIATEQTLQPARKRCEAKGSFDVLKKTFFERLSLFSRCFIRNWFGSHWYKGSVSFLGTATKYVVKSTNKLLSIRMVYREIDILQLMVANFKNISYESPRNNSFKPFQFCLIVLSVLLAIFLAW